MNTYDGTDFADPDIVEWQKKIIRRILALNIDIPGTALQGDMITKLYVHPNRFATRAEVFTFAKNLLNVHMNVSGEVKLDVNVEAFR